jgi:hypothetical protein
LKNAGDMARRGFGVCEKRESYLFLSPTHRRECARFRLAVPDVVTARRKFIDGNA